MRELRERLERMFERSWEPEEVRGPIVRGSRRYQKSIGDLSVSGKSESDNVYAPYMSFQDGGRDWGCDYCETANEYGMRRCDNCGAPKEV